MKKVLLVEDDHLQAEGIRSKLREEFPDLQINTISTEAAFRAALDEIAAAGYSVAIVDVMLRWADAAPNMPDPPEDVRAGGFFHGGIRFKDILRSRRETEKLPIIFYSVLDSGKLAPEETGDAEFVPKASGFTGLIEAVKRHLES